MDQLFAPWRIEWVERDDHEDDVDGCPFCVLPARDADRKNRIVARSDHAFVLLNNSPYNPGHVMVIPDRHVGRWSALSEAALLDHAQLKTTTIEAMEAAFGPDGVNAGENIGGAAAGGSIGDHLHTHLVPRWEGDTSFMPIVSDTKVIVEALAETFDRLHEAVADRPAATVRGDDDAVELSF
ncbi:MAG: HIT domain-containing protein [Halolamina sp.]